MMDKSKLRGADIITGVLFFILGIYIIAEALTMPLKDSYAGVESVWYVSPALMPLIIGAAMIFLAVYIIVFAFRHGGVAALKMMMAERKGEKFLSDKNIRYAAVLVPLISMVYLNLTRIDFFITIVLFLVYTITVFHVDDAQIMRKLTFLYTAEMVFFLLLVVSGLDKLLTKLFAYSNDILALIYIATIIIAFSRNIRKSGVEIYRKRFAQAMWMTWMTPVVLVPAFRFMLRVPLPFEGIIVNAMSFVYYAIKQ